MKRVDNWLFSFVLLLFRYYYSKIYSIPTNERIFCEECSSKEQSQEFYTKLKYGFILAYKSQCGTCKEIIEEKRFLPVGSALFSKERSRRKIILGLEREYKGVKLFIIKAWIRFLIYIKSLISTLILFLAFLIFITIIVRISSFLEHLINTI
jgi:hypothetical protein